MPYFVYILRSESTDAYYIGQTNDLEQRLNKHNLGLVRSTKAARPWVRIWCEAHPTRSLAMKREREIKRWKSRIMIERLIDRKGVF